MTISALINQLTWNERMETLRAINKWSQDKAAEMCGTNKKNYWMWASGKSFPRRNSRRAISMAFGVPEFEIFGEAMNQ
jgi:transcriptional regulator with XRE-family HTH domain